MASALDWFTEASPALLVLFTSAAQLVHRMSAHCEGVEGTDPPTPRPETPNVAFDHLQGDGPTDTSPLGRLDRVRGLCLAARRR